ncbi:uncharacterized protein LOC122380786 [Amphibalanus amphitrite]|uniref:uncharacterized protein LOC122380786 n=1 Tax=Amphibalanus amphitrite TaxID=1232801 RepID=UPI001C919EF1|nr:uncharacterized protein LOC122380786 [Amphibalanus amphitrite]
MSLQFATIRDRHCAQVVRTKAFCQRTEQASQASKVWTDLGMIMGLEEDVKEHVLHKIRHTAKKYAQTMINVEPADKDDDELLALLAYGCGTTIGTLADPRNGVRQAGEELSVDGVVVCQLPATRLETVALMTAAHAVFYTKFTGPCRALFEILYTECGIRCKPSWLITEGVGGYPGSVEPASEMPTSNDWRPVAHLWFK